MIPTAAWARPDADAYTRFVFTPAASEVDADQAIGLDALDLFVINGHPTEPAFVRARYRARVDDQWVEVDAGEQTLNFFPRDDYQRAQGAIEAQVRRLADEVRVAAPDLSVVPFDPDVMIAAAWFDNSGLALRRLGGSGANVYVNSEIAVATPLHDFKNPTNPLPVWVRFRHLTWDAAKPAVIHLADRLIRGRVHAVTPTPDDVRALDWHLRARSCAEAILH